MAGISLWQLLECVHSVSAGPASNSISTRPPKSPIFSNAPRLCNSQLLHFSWCLSDLSHPLFTILTTISCTVLVVAPYVHAYGPYCEQRHFSKLKLVLTIADHRTHRTIKHHSLVAIPSFSSVVRSAPPALTALGSGKGACTDQPPLLRSIRPAGLCRSLFRNATHKYYITQNKAEIKFILLVIAYRYWILSNQH